MRIGIDLRYLLPGRVGGTEIYVRNLVRAMAEENRGHEIRLFTNPENAGSFGELHGVSESGEWSLRMGMDVLFFPGTTMIPLRSRQPSVVTVHDLQHVHLPRNFSLRERFRRRRRDRPSAGRADAVIAISDFTKKALCADYGLEPGRITVIPMGVDRGFFGQNAAAESAGIRSKYGLSGPFVFYPARFWPHKNHARLFDAMDLLRSEARFPYLLVLSGETAPSSLPESVRTLGHVPAADMPPLYRAADALVFPSLYEGFGLPVLEAMAARCPVICSATAALPEVAGDAAVFVNPEDPGSIAAGLRRVLSDDDLRAGLVARGIARAEGFSWQQTARKTLDVLEQVAHG